MQRQSTFFNPIIKARGRLRRCIHVATMVRFRSFPTHKYAIWSLTRANSHSIQRHTMADDRTALFSDLLSTSPHSLHSSRSPHSSCSRHSSHSLHSSPSSLRSSEVLKQLTPSTRTPSFSLEGMPADSSPSELYLLPVNPQTMSTLKHHQEKFLDYIKLFRGRYGKLEDESQRLKDGNQQSNDENQWLKHENQRLKDENQRLKNENQRLKKNQQLMDDYQRREGVSKWVECGYW